jgi:hypothetical protein
MLSGIEVGAPSFDVSELAPEVVNENALQLDN